MNGTLDQLGGRWRLTFVRHITHRCEQVWPALTDRAKLAMWFPADVEGDRVAGAALRFVFRNGEGPPADGTMITFAPPSILEFVWGHDALRFDLRPDGRRCVLTFVVSFGERGRAARDAAGWEVCLDGLADVLAGAPSGELAGTAANRGQGGRWEQLHRGYVETFGPEAATIGPPASTTRQRGDRA